jgi:hypothetical protein
VNIAKHKKGGGEHSVKLISSYLENLLHLTVLLNPRFWLGNLKFLYQKSDHRDETGLLSMQCHLNHGQLPTLGNNNKNAKLSTMSTSKLSNELQIYKMMKYLCQQTSTSDVRESPVLVCWRWKNIIPCWMKWQTCNWTFMRSKNLSCLWCWNIPHTNSCIWRSCYH